MSRLRSGVPLVLIAVAVLSAAAATFLAMVVTGSGPFAQSSSEAVATTGATAAGGPGNSASLEPSTGPVDPIDPSPVDPDGSARRFLDDYVDRDGRVVRHDQGGDTVSEGQAYAMLLAVSLGDRPTFERVWSWTRTHLQRPDGLLSWTWRDGAVEDANSAADADVDAAHALVLAGESFDDPALRAEGIRLGEDVLDHETVTTPIGRVLLAGQWASAAPYRVNPSYSSPTAYALLGKASGDPRWAEVSMGDRAVLGELLDAVALPPDWAQVQPDGTVQAMPPPGGGEVAYGLDAQRIPVRLAASCDPADRRDVTRIAKAATLDQSDLRGIYDLGGSPLVTWSHPLAYVSAAAIADTTGAQTRGATLLGQAAALDRRSGTYYGAAWSALGAQLLQQPHTLGATCSPAAKETSR